MQQGITELLPAGKLKILKLGRSVEPISSRSPNFCIVTFFDPERDSWVRKNYGLVGLRRHKLLRIATEAYEQEMPLSQEVISFDILGCGLRTLQRDTTFFVSRGIFVPFQRAPQRGRKNLYLYKVAAARMFLDNVPKLEISLRLYLQPEVTSRYIREFANAVKWAGSGLAASQIRTVAAQSEVLIQEYLSLFRAYNTPDLFKSLELLTKTLH